MNQDRLFKSYLNELIEAQKPKKRKLQVKVAPKVNNVNRAWFEALKDGKR